MTTEQDLRASPPQSQMDLWRELQAILAEWREAERRLANTQPGSAEHARESAEVARLRERYHRVFSRGHPQPDY